MRLKEYVRLGRVSLRSRKKSTRNTVCGIAFGLSILVAVVFFTLAFSLDLTGAIDSARSVTCFSISVANEIDPQGDYDGSDAKEEFGGVLFGNKERDALFAAVGGAVDEIVSQEYMSVSGEYTLNGEPLMTEWTEGMYGYVIASSIKIVRGEGEDIVPAGIRSDLTRLGLPFLAAGRVFSQNSKGEVMVSETMVRVNGMTPEEAIGGRLSLYDEAGNSGVNNLSCALDNDNDPDNEYVKPYEPIKKDAVVFQDFKIVGVISEAYYQLNDILEKDADVWISGDSYYGETEPTLPKYQPVLRFHTDNDGRVTCVGTYVDGFETMQQAALEDGMFFAAYPAVIGESVGTTVYNPVVYFVQCKDFRSSLEIAELCQKGYRRFGRNYNLQESINNVACSSYKDFLTLYQVGNYVMLFLYVFGGTIFFGTMLNLFNSVNYSVQVRQRYLGMMRAIGAKRRVLLRLYAAEILLIFARSLPWTILFGGGLSLGIKLGVDAAFAGAETVFSVAIRLRFGFFFAALGIALAVMLLVAFVFSRIACRRVVHAPVTEVLAAES